MTSTATAPSRRPYLGPRGPRTEAAFRRPDVRPALASLSDAERTAFDRRFEGVRKFAADDLAPRTPVALRLTLSTAQFVALSGADRVAVLQAAALADVLAGRVHLAPPPSANASPVDAPPEEPGPADDVFGIVQFARGGLFVQCAVGCGRFVPARSPRAVLAFCKAHRRRAAHRTRRRRPSPVDF